MPRLTKTYWLSLSTSIFFCIIGFVAIFISDSLTVSTELQDFNTYHWKVLLVFLVAELFCWGFAFFFAVKCGKIINERNIQWANECHARLSKYHDSGLEKYDNIIGIEYSWDFRAVLISFNNSVTLITEQFDFNLNEWVAYGDTSVYGNLDDAKNAVKESFEPES